MEQNILLPFLLTLFAGLSTGIGSVIAFFAKSTNKKFLSFSLGLSAGVMIYISFVELFPQSQRILIQEYGREMGMSVTVLFFFAGVLLIGIIDRLVPQAENPHEMRSVEDMEDKLARAVFKMYVPDTVSFAVTCLKDSELETWEISIGLSSFSFSLFK